MDGTGEGGVAAPFPEADPDADLYGARVTVHQLDLAKTGYPIYFADLTVSGRSVVEGPGAVPETEVARLQRPCGGVVCIGRPGAMRKRVRGPLEGAGTWTHQFGNAANTFRFSAGSKARSIAIW